MISSKGVLVRDDQNEKGGTFMIEDDYGNYLGCSWIKNVIIDEKDVWIRYIALMHSISGKQIKILT
jgi:hypothetical protein